MKTKGRTRDNKDEYFSILSECISPPLKHIVSALDITSGLTGSSLKFDFASTTPRPTVPRPLRAELALRPSA